MDKAETQEPKATISKGDKTGRQGGSGSTQPTEKCTNGDNAGRQGGGNRFWQGAETNEKTNWEDKTMS